MNPNGQDNEADTGLARLLGQIARSLQAEPDVDATLMAIVKAAVDYVDGAE
ncbi:hypothetical protein [Amycolatopsis rifamycinica]|uniref:hypothetical protein n=1 Tax=Amycolatopsis rifamycinica TaxID=287986 RepID=UPI000A709B3B|nr:hypothetical protein [Amycolatopsis rifamycinica]